MEMVLIPGKKYYVSDGSIATAEEYRAEKDKSQLMEYIGYDRMGRNLFKTSEGEEITWNYAVPVEPVEQQESKLQEGDEVWVSNNSTADAITKREGRIYLMSLKNGNHLCVYTGDEGKYRSDMAFETHTWNYVVPVSKEITLTKKQIAEKFNIPEGQTFRIEE